MEKKYIMDGYAFPTAADYERAKKEKETVAYLSANTDLSNMKEVYKVYKTAVEKRSFYTVYGLEYLQKLRRTLIGSGVAEDALEPVPAGAGISAVSAGNKGAAPGAKRMSLSQSEKKVKEYQEAYEKAKAGSMVKNFLIVILAAVIGGMFFITSKSQYSVLTYFTNYEEKIRDEVVNEYEEWETRLNKKEQELAKKEQKLKEKTVR